MSKPRASWGLGIHYPPPSSAAHSAVITEFQQATLEGLINLKPIGTAIRRSHPRVRGVIGIEQIPYTITRSELKQEISARYAVADGFPVHVIMERSTGKTMNCYIETANPGVAAEAVRASNSGEVVHSIRSRRVELTLSNQGELMKAVFPNAKCVDWSSEGEPTVRQPRPDEVYSTGFTGFFADEELRCLSSYAEFPKCNNFTKRVLQRTFESLLSAVSKYPWHRTELYTVRERNNIFETMRFMLELLIYKISRPQQEIGLDMALVGDIIDVGLRCPAFNPRMKYCLIEFGGRIHLDETWRRLSPEALAYFPFDTLTWVKKDPSGLQFYGGLIADGEIPPTDETAQVGLINHWANGHNLLEPYGHQWYEWDVDKINSEWKYENSIIYEEGLLHKLIKSGYNQVQISIDSAQNSSARVRNFTGLDEEEEED
ncbi:uncharacterized protein N7483_006114 [Penicillium malachiteum]|uniref:uncharacterized protein n=1 Tax=Penicillium malachiteum TaxID=1324776 RepID=UPI0025465B63|nr:uncharacterized protein N7483_006114 [Penicillium malachiteum]KAJ5731606.1 hypothetical protein N7483_006114 [Penicillium malachiteum]